MVLIPLLSTKVITRLSSFPTPLRGTMSPASAVPSLCHFARLVAEANAPSVQKPPSVQTIRLSDMVGW